MECVQEGSLAVVLLLLFAFHNSDGTWYRDKFDDKFDQTNIIHTPMKSEERRIVKADCEKALPLKHTPRVHNTTSSYRN